MPPQKQAYQRVATTNSVFQGQHLLSISWPVPRAHASSVVWFSLSQCQEMIGADSTIRHEPEGERTSHSRPMSPGPL